jgi:hypothetical protein
MKKVERHLHDDAQLTKCTIVCDLVVDSHTVSILSGIFIAFDACYCSFMVCSDFYGSRNMFCLLKLKLVDANTYSGPFRDDLENLKASTSN